MWGAISGVRGCLGEPFDRNKPKFLSEGPFYIFLIIL